MAYLTKISDLAPELVNADPKQIYIPKVLMEHKDFKGLKFEAKVLYSFLLDRLREPLDFIHKGYDDNGATYIHFKVEELCELLNLGKSTVVSLKKQLAQYGLIEEVKVGSGQPNRFYLTDKLVSYLKE